MGLGGFWPNCSFLLTRMSLKSIDGWVWEYTLTQIFVLLSGPKSSTDPVPPISQLFNSYARMSPQAARLFGPVPELITEIKKKKTLSSMVVRAHHDPAVTCIALCLSVSHTPQTQHSSPTHLL